MGSLLSDPPELSSYLFELPETMTYNHIPSDQNFRVHRFICGWRWIEGIIYNIGIYIYNQYV